MRYYIYITLMNTNQKEKNMTGIKICSVVGLWYQLTTTFKDMVEVTKLGNLIIYDRQVTDPDKISCFTLVCKTLNFKKIHDVLVTVRGDGVLVLPQHVVSTLLYLILTVNEDGRTVNGTTMTIFKDWMLQGIIEKKDVLVKTDDSFAQSFAKHLAGGTFHYLCECDLPSEYHISREEILNDVEANRYICFIPNNLEVLSYNGELKAWDENGNDIQPNFQIFKVCKVIDVYDFTREHTLILASDIAFE